MRDTDLKCLPDTRTHRPGDRGSRGEPAACPFLACR